MPTELDRKIEAINNELTGIYRDLHRRPELGFEEYRTSEKIADCLRAWGYEVTSGIGGTGVIGVLFGAGAGPTLAIRACLDALEVSEETGVEYASEIEGHMHACGHDGNMTVTLGAARILSEYREALNGNIKIVFQPSEENTGGAAEIIKFGGLKNPDVDRIITPHIWHDIPKGIIGLKPGPVMAGSDLFRLCVHGAAGHGAWPHMCVDPLPAAAEIILSLQRLVGREIDPMAAACVTVGKMEYGTAPNIISGTVTMHGTVRTFDSGLRDFIQKRISEIAEGITRASGASYTLEYDRVMPPLVNDAEFTAFAAEAVARSMGGEAVTADYAPTMGCEEFSLFLDHVPGVFMLIGSHVPGEPVTELHNPRFLFPEDCISTGVKALCEIALALFKSGR